MKKVILTIVTIISIATTLVSCEDKNIDSRSLLYNRESWKCYAEKYCADVMNPTDDEVNGYLDWYVGSTEEEEDMCVADMIEFNSRNIKELISNHSGYWAVYDDQAQGLDCELLHIDSETFERLQVCLDTQYGKMKGYLVMNEVGEYMYRHKTR